MEELYEAELDELWSFVGSKQNQRWLWVAIDHNTRVVLAFTFGKRKDVVFRKLKKLLEPFNITMFYTDGWGSYERNLNRIFFFLMCHNPRENKGLRHFSHLECSHKS